MSFVNFEILDVFHVDETFPDFVANLPDFGVARVFSDVVFRLVLALVLADFLHQHVALLRVEFVDFHVANARILLISVDSNFQIRGFDDRNLFFVAQMRVQSFVVVLVEFGFLVLGVDADQFSLQLEFEQFVVFGLVLQFDLLWVEFDELRGFLTFLRLRAGLFLQQLHVFAVVDGGFDPELAVFVVEVGFVVPGAFELADVLADVLAEVPLAGRLVAAEGVGDGLGVRGLLVFAVFLL